ncbi:MAG TPA: hypothetical protein VGF23_07180 [Gaiellaceae bacterium]|jgi:hypothetical protein
MHVIADELRDSWLDDLAADLLAAIERYLARWAAFEEFLGEPAV